MPAKASAKLALSIEGMDAEGRVQLGAPASLVIEGVLPEPHEAKNCLLVVAVTTAGTRGRAQDAEEAQFTLNVDEFLDGSGPFLCQIDFEPETIGEIFFEMVLVEEPTTVLAHASAGLRVVNALRDPSGRVRKAGPGALKVKK